MNKAVFGLAVLMLVASLIPACGGGSGGATASSQGAGPASSTVTFDNAASGMVATQVQAALDEMDARLDALAASATRVHQSTVSGAVIIPANSTTFVVRSIVFTPVNPADRILSVTAEGTYDVGIPDMGNFLLEISDAAGQFISGNATLAVTNAAGHQASAVGTGSSYRLYSTLADRFFSGSGGSNPSNSYTIKMTVSTGSSWSGRVNSLRFSVMTTEGVTVISSSPRIAG